MGAYGGTSEASMSLSDAGNISNLDNDPDDKVDFNDLRILLSKWLEERVLLPEDLNRNGMVNFIDHTIFTDEWSGIISYPGSPIVYEISDCDMGSLTVEQSGQTRFSVTVEGLYIHFEDMMTANCCPDELELQMTVEDNLITIYEIEYVTMPCLCICDYPVTARLGPFEPGVYTLEVYEDWGGFIGSTIVTLGPPE